MNKKLFKQIKTFYKKYDTQHLFENNKVTFTKKDMYNLNSLMSAYESVWFTLQDYEDHKTCKFLTNLYGELSDYIDYLPYIQNPKHHTMKNLFKTTALILIMGAIFMLGIHIGRQYTIHNAQLYNITENGYELQFGNDIHYYE